MINIYLMLGKEPGTYQDWEAILAKEGMPSELGEDKAAKKLKEMQETTSGPSPEEKILKAIQEYWVFRSGSKYGEHLKAAQDIADRLGISADMIDEAMMKELEEQIAEAERGVDKIAVQIFKENPQMRMNQKGFENRLRRMARKEFSHISDAALDKIIETTSQQKFGY